MCFSFASNTFSSCLKESYLLHWVCLHCVLSHVIPKRALYLWLLFKNVRDKHKEIRNKRDRSEKNTPRQPWHSASVAYEWRIYIYVNDKIKSHEKARYWFSKKYFIAIYVQRVKLISTTNIPRSQKQRQIDALVTTFSIPTNFMVVDINWTKSIYILYSMDHCDPKFVSGGGNRVEFMKIVLTAVDLLTDKLYLVCDLRCAAKKHSNSG